MPIAMSSRQTIRGHILFTFSYLAIILALKKKNNETEAVSQIIWCVLSMGLCWKPMETTWGGFQHVLWHLSAVVLNLFEDGRSSQGLNKELLVVASTWKDIAGYSPSLDHRFTLTCKRKTSWNSKQSWSTLGSSLMPYWYCLRYRYFFPSKRNSQPSSPSSRHWCHIFPRLRLQWPQMFPCDSQSRNKSSIKQICHNGPWGSDISSNKPIFQYLS